VRLAAALVLTFGLAVAACSPGYILRAGYEEAKILWRRQPIEELLRQPTLDTATRQKLELVLVAREFARDELALNVDGRYSTYATVDDAQLVHVLIAAERFRLEPYTWWFPIVGRVPYKGYFSEDEARAEAAHLEGEGFDTHIRTASAFSTLGWFDDPLLSTMLRRDRIDLVETVVHELLHSTFYLGGETGFDESFANFVGHRGAIAFFHAAGDGDAARQAEENWSDALCFSEFLGGFAAELRRVYAAGIGAKERAQHFERAQSRLRQLPFANNGYRGLASIQLNNAIILHQLLYFDRLALFEAAFEARGRDLAATIRVLIDATSAADTDPFAALAVLSDAGDPKRRIEKSSLPNGCAFAVSKLESVQPTDAGASRDNEDGD
jgi:predicted aminopeptidase